MRVGRPFKRSMHALFHAFYRCIVSQILRQSIENVIIIWERLLKSRCFVIQSSENEPMETSDNENPSAIISNLMVI
jgi:hypothetical protein